MSNLAKLEFSPLDISGKNYMPWTIDIETHLDSMDLHETIIEGNTSSKVDKAKSLIFLRRHLDENLQNGYLTVKDPSDLWKNLKDRVDHQRDVMLPLYRDKWATLRFQDFAKVGDYNSEMIKIVSHHRERLKQNHLCFLSVFKVIFVGLFTHHVDHFDTLWY
ncbi:unnamed protein product [Rhodiola kirilowii]